MSSKLRLKRAAKIAVSTVYLGYLEARRFFAPAPSLTILYYHAVSGTNARENFARQLDCLARHADVLPADHCGALPAGRHAVAITFDDAFRSVAANALPELARRGMCCTIFAPSGVLGRNPDWAMEEGAMEGVGDRKEVVMSADELKAVASPLVTIGSHTVSHPRLSCISVVEVFRELQESRNALSRLIGRSVDLIAFPYGDHDESVLTLSRRAGYTRVFTIRPEPVDPERNAFALGRVSADPCDGAFEFYLKMRGAYAWMPAASRLKARLSAFVHAAPLRPHHAA